MIVERSVGFEVNYLEKMISVSATSLDNKKNGSVTFVCTDCNEMDNDPPKAGNGAGAIQKLPTFDPNNPKHEAAIRLQKVYKSFRTRRKLADCAVLVEHSWWKLLDFVELKHSSISFFGLEKPESAISRWARARTRAAKVGKGLSKNDKAQKLALQHWLEAIDPRHRYGHNLHFYYVKWLHSKSKEPFFYWLDVGEGKEVNLVDKCPRSKLQQQCVRYLGPMERKAYEVVIEDSKFVYKERGELLDTTEDAKWIFVLSTSKNLYVGKKKKGAFQHSSFLAGGATIAAGRLIVQNGILKAVWPHSGHYRPTEENFKDFLSFLSEKNVDLIDVKKTPVDDDEDSSSKQSGKHSRTSSFDDPITKDMHVEDSTLDGQNSATEESSAASCQQKSSGWLNFIKKLTFLEIPKRDKMLESEAINTGQICKDETTKSHVEVHESGNGELSTQPCSIEPEQNLHDLEHGEHEVTNIPEEAILQRINSKKDVGSYQLGKQLSCKWTTGAGPRIGCVRDYPSKLQSHALEKMRLSPRANLHSKSTNSLSLNASAQTTLSEGSLPLTITKGDHV